MPRSDQPRRLALAAARHTDLRHPDTVVWQVAPATVDLLLGEVRCEWCGDVFAYTDDSPVLPEDRVHAVR